MIFLLITRELIKGEVDAFDKSVLLAVDKIRTPLLTIGAVDLTALGSNTLVTLFSIFTLIVLLLLRDRFGAFQLFAASAGATLLTLVTKNVFERVRPAEAQRLVVVSGFSYPSGHSLAASALYLTIAIIACRHIRHAGARISIVLGASLLILTVGASRIYLGVHYATDVIGGVSLGAAWALLLAACFTHIAQRRALIKG